MHSGSCLIQNVKNLLQTFTRTQKLPTQQHSAAQYTHPVFVLGAGSDAATQCMYSVQHSEPGCEV